MMTTLCPASIHPPFGNYAHGVFMADSGLVITSGQLAISKDGAIPESAAEQAALCFDNILAILNEANMNAANIVQLKAYVTERQYFADYMSARDGFLQGRTIASTLLVVSGFSRPEFKVEIEAVAFASPTKPK